MTDMYSTTVGRSLSEQTPCGQIWISSEITSCWFLQQLSMLGDSDMCYRIITWMMMQQTKPVGLSWGGVYDRPSAYGPTSIWGVKPSFARVVTNKCFVFCLNKCNICPNWGVNCPPCPWPPSRMPMWPSNFIGLVIGLTHGSNLWVKPIMGKTCLFSAVCQALFILYFY